MAMYEMGWVVARAAVAGRCKVPEDYPFDLKGLLGEEEPDEEMPVMSEEEAQKNLDAMRRSLMAKMRERAANGDGVALTTPHTEQGAALYGRDGNDK